MIDHQFIKMKDGVELHTHINESGKSRWLIITHGIGEHLRRHNYLLELFRHDYNIMQYDLRGHGRSQGRRGYAPDFSIFRKDLKEVIQFLVSEYKLKDHVLFGHSMGALITASYLQSIKDEPDHLYPSKVFLSAPACSPGGPFAHLRDALSLGVTGFLQKLKWSVALPGLVDLKNLSHNPEVAIDYVKDPLNIQKTHTKLAIGLLHSGLETFTKPLRAKCPLYVAIGSEDKIVSFKHCVEYFTQMEKGTQLEIIHGAYHEMHNETAEYRNIYFNFLKSSLALF
jgi:acylglycerol lipase